MDKEDAGIVATIASAVLVAVLIGVALVSWGPVAPEPYDPGEDRGRITIVEHKVGILEAHVHDHVAVQEEE